MQWWGEQVPSNMTAVLSVEEAPRRGYFNGVFLTPSAQMEPVHILKVVGPGMRREFTPEGQAAFAEPELTPKDRERWSRLIGVLGEEAYLRLRSLRFCLVGVGRTGSLVATSLARLGIRYLTLTDPDRLDVHNLDAMNGAWGKDVGRLKVNALRDYAVSINDCPEETRALPESITTLRAFVSAKEADVLISCVDDDGARLATAIIAALYAKPLLDVGTGTFHESSTQQSAISNLRRGAGLRRMGADIRLILPGERCLLCFGGVANLEQARTIFGMQGASLPARRPWQEVRAGSSRSLNEIAAHLGLRLLEDLIGERVQNSMWEHLEFDPHGRPSLEDVTPPPNPDCPLCRRTGEGDEGLANIRGVEPTLAQSTTS